MSISDQPIGTKHSGYAGPKDGPFMCSRCVHYKDTDKGTGCEHKDVIEDLGKGKSGLAPVSPDGCCNYFRPHEIQAKGMGSRLVSLK